MKVNTRPLLYSSEYRPLICTHATYYTKASCSFPPSFSFTVTEKPRTIYLIENACTPLSCDKQKTKNTCKHGINLCMYLSHGCRISAPKSYSTLQSQCNLCSDNGLKSDYRLWCNICHVNRCPDEWDLGTKKRRKKKDPE